MKKLQNNFWCFCLVIFFLLVLPGCSQNKDSTYQIKFYKKIAGHYTWGKSVWASEYDQYSASADLILDTCGYFTWKDDFPTGPEADEFNLTSYLNGFGKHNLFDSKPLYPNEFIESRGKYEIINDSCVELIFFTIKESIVKDMSGLNEPKFLIDQLNYESKSEISSPNNIIIINGGLINLYSIRLNLNIKK